MYVIHTETGKQVQAKISILEANEFAAVKKSKRFNFDWNKEKEYAIYKLTIYNNQILGLLSLRDRREDCSFEIRLLASSKENVGDIKQYQRIAGCLIAFACTQAFIGGYDGYVCLKPKTKLEQHYKRVYGMVSTPKYLITQGKNSLDLISKYYEDKTEG